MTTGTGSGKSLTYLIPIYDAIMRDHPERHTVRAIIVYPMNALAEDQLGRLRSLLAGTGIPFGMYVGKTPENESAVAGIRLPVGSSRADYEAKLAEVRREKRSETVYPPEELCSREAMRTWAITQSLASACSAMNLTQGLEAAGSGSLISRISSCST